MQVSSTIPRTLLIVSSIKKKRHLSAQNFGSTLVHVLDLSMLFGCWRGFKHRLNEVAIIIISLVL